MKKLLPLSLVALLAVVIVINNTGMFSSATASARELVEQAIGKVKVQVAKHDASTEQQLEKELSSLEKAKDAKDLAYLGEEDAGEKGKVKKLSFTDENGKKVTIAFDEDNNEDPVDVEEEDGEHENVAASTQESESQESEVKSADTEEKESVESKSEGTEIKESEKPEVSEEKSAEAAKEAAPETSTESEHVE